MQKITPFLWFDHEAEEAAKVVGLRRVGRTMPGAILSPSGSACCSLRSRKIRSRSFTELRGQGYGDDVIAKAREVTDATAAVMVSHFENGYEKLAAVKARFGAEPWFGKIKGEFTGDILASDETTLRREGRAKYDNLDIDWHYDALAELRKVKAPQLWIVAGVDREAPPDLTIQRLEQLRNERKDITTVRFPNTDHGMYEFNQAPDGTRTSTRVADGYYRLLADWIKGEKHPPYGAAEWLTRKERFSRTGTGNTSAKNDLRNLHDFQ